MEGRNALRIPTDARGCDATCQFIGQVFGLRFDVTETQLGESGRLLLRYSGTESLARVMIEGKHQDEIESYAHRLASAIETELGAA